MLVKMYVSHPVLLTDYQLRGVRVMEAEIASTYGGFTRYQGVGCWKDGEAVMDDVVDIYEVLIPSDRTERTVIDLFSLWAKELGILLDQSAIPFCVLPSTNYILYADA